MKARTVHLTDDARGRARRIAGLYAITPDLADTASLLRLVEAAIAGGASTVQYRNKVAAPALRIEQASRLASLCASFDARLVINDHADLAMSIAGAGLHVGADDCEGPAALGALRSRLGDDRVLGVSCYRDLELARAAVSAGADYVAFGSVFASTTKPHAPRAGLDLFGRARELGVATVGIGGITQDNVEALVSAGADAAAVIGALFDGADPAFVSSRARALTRPFDRLHTKYKPTCP